MGTGVKKRELGLAGAIMVLTQVLSNAQSVKSVNTEIDSLRTEIVQLRADQSQYFVKKTELKKVIVKLDKMNNRLARMSTELRNLRLAHPDQVLTRGIGL